MAGKKSKGERLPDLSCLGALVYSTNPSLDLSGGEEEDGPSVPPERQQLKVFRDAKARKGKEVTIVEGFVGSDADLQELGRELKKHCGVGGSVKDGTVVIQGNFVVKVTDYLLKKGYKAKKSGV